MTRIRKGRAALLATYRETRAAYAKEPAQAARLVGGERQPGDVVERAAWATLANLVLNLDEAITKE